MGFSRQEYWSGLPFPSSGDLPSPGSEPRSLALQADSSPSEPKMLDRLSGFLNLLSLVLHWASLICVFRIFVKFGEKISHYFFKYFLCTHFSLLFCKPPDYMCVRLLEVVPHFLFFWE